MNFPTRSLLSALATVFLIFPVTLQAEETLPDLKSDVAFEEKSVQWSPHSVTVLTKEELESTYRPDLEEIEGMVPGLIVDRMNTTPRGAAIAIRGLGTSGASKGFDPAVAVKVDGVYVGTHTGRMQVLFDFQKIEVARGPQGVLDGNPNISGSINIERTRPTGELGADLRVSAGIDERREFDGVFNFPVVEGVNAKLAIYWKDRGGAYMSNVFSGRDENTEDYTLATGSVSWDYRDWFSMLYSYDNERSDESTPALLNISSPDDLLCATTQSLPFPNCRRGVGNPELDSRHTTAQNFSNKRDFQGDYHTLRFDFEFAGFKGVSITGLRSTDEHSDLDLDASNADFYHLTQDQEYNQMSQELGFSKQHSENLNYEFGVYFLNSDYDIFQQEFHILKQLGDAGFTEGHSAGEIQELTSEQTSNLQSVYANFEYVINDQWIVDIGGRWSQVEREFEHSPSRIRLGGNVSPLRTFLLGKEDSKEFLRSAGISYKVDEEAMIYARYAEGFLPGGFDENAMSAFTGNSYGSETNRSFEIGLKSDWQQDRLRVNIAYLETQLNNKLERFNTLTPEGDIESMLDNVAQIEVSGWELELESIPVDQLRIKMAYSHLNANYDSYHVPDLENPGSYINLSHLTSNRAPGNNLFLSANYSLPIGPGTLHTYAAYRLLKDYQTNSLIPEAEVSNWTAWDLSVAYEWQEWQFRLFSKNVKNKEYIQNVNRILQTDILPVGAGSLSVPSLVTFTEYNQPRYTGFEIIYQPDF